MKRIWPFYQKPIPGRIFKGPINVSYFMLLQRFVFIGRILSRSYVSYVFLFFLKHDFILNWLPWLPITATPLAWTWLIRQANKVTSNNNIKFFLVIFALAGSCLEAKISLILDVVSFFDILFGLIQGLFLRELKRGPWTDPELQEVPVPYFQLVQTSNKLMLTSGV